MARFPKSFFSLVMFLGGLFLGMGVVGCNQALPPSETPEAASTPQTPVDAAPSTPATPSESGQKPDAAEPATVEPAKNLAMVSIYVIDDACNDFVQESVQVEADHPIRDAVGQVIERYKFNAFSLAGYDVNVDKASGAATIDLRLAPDSQRQFVSLSSCEQRTLFGSLEETLIQNKDWNIKTVRFTSQGEEIVL